METKTYLLLLALNRENAKFAKEVLAKVKRDIDPKADVEWIDSRGAGVFIESTHPAWKVMGLAVPQDDLSTRDDRTAIRDVLVLQIGPDHASANGSGKAAAWMNARFPAR